MCMGCGGMCGRCKGGKKAIIGALILLNIYVWPKWVGSIDKWLAFLGVLMVIGGVLMYVMPSCPHCREDASAKKPGKK